MVRIQKQWMLCFKQKICIAELASISLHSIIVTEESKLLLPGLERWLPTHLRQCFLKVTGYKSGRGNHAQLDSTYLTQRNSQTSQLGPGERPRMYTMQTASAVEDLRVHTEIRWSIPTQTSHQIAQQPLTLQAHPTCSRPVTVASSDWQKLFGIIPSIWEKLGKNFAKCHIYCKDYCINMEWRTLKKSFCQSLFMV